jgi:serine/threonine-protein kinase
MTRLASTGVRLTKFFTELRRRRVFRVGAAYALVGWFLIQAADVIVEPLRLPEWIQPLLIMTVFLGFPVALLLAWAFDLTPGGVERTPLLGSEDEVTEAAPIPVGAAPARADAERSVAVLPFANLSQAADNEYFSDGITDDLITHLSKIKDLRVISRTSVMRFKQRTSSVQDIGRELGVARILEGSVRRAGSRVRINAQLIDARTDDHLWAEIYDRDLEDIFAIQLDVTSRIAEALHAHLSRAEETHLAKKPTDDMEAYDLFLKGRYHWNRRSEADLFLSVDFLKRAVDRDPDYSLALAALADSYVTLGFYGALRPEEAMLPAGEAAGQALALDESAAPALVSRGSVRSFYDRDWAAAESDYKAAIEISPGYALAHHWYATNLLLPLGRFAEGRERLQRARELDPLSPSIRVSFGVLAYFEREYRQAVEELRTLVASDPGFGMAYFVIGGCHEQLGEHAEAVAAFRKAVDLSGKSAEMIAALGHSLALAGQSAEARRCLDELVRRSRESYVSPTRLAQVRLGLGERDAALDLLSEAAEIRAADLVWIGVSPVYDPLRSEGRFQTISHRVLGR